MRNRGICGARHKGIAHQEPKDAKAGKSARDGKLPSQPWSRRTANDGSQPPPAERGRRQCCKTGWAGASSIFGCR